MFFGFSAIIKARDDDAIARAGGKRIMNIHIKRMAILVLALLAAIPVVRAESCPLLDGAGNTVATVGEMEGLAAAPELSASSDTPEYYFVPVDKASPIRFVYYTTGAGDPMALAQAALSSYSMLYDEFSAGEILQEAVADRDCLRFRYTCAYPDRSGAQMVYEQTAVAYLPLSGESFIACILSLAFDDAESYWSAEALDDRLETALGAIQMAE